MKITTLMRHQKLIIFGVIVALVGAFVGWQIFASKKPSPILSIVSSKTLVAQEESLPHNHPFKGKARLFKVDSYRERLEFSGINVFVFDKIYSFPDGKGNVMIEWHYGSVQDARGRDAWRTSRGFEPQLSAKFIDASGYEFDSWTQGHTKYDRCVKNGSPWKKHPRTWGDIGDYSGQTVSQATAEIRITIPEHRMVSCHHAG